MSPSIRTALVGLLVLLLIFNQVLYGIDAVVPAMPSIGAGESIITTAAVAGLSRMVVSTAPIDDGIARTTEAEAAAAATAITITTTSDQLSETLTTTPPTTTTTISQQQKQPSKIADPHFCIIQSSTVPLRLPRKSIRHMAHALEILLPCWSWFQSRNAATECNLIAMHPIRFDSNGQNWLSQFLQQSMRCSIHNFDRRTVIRFENGQHDLNRQINASRFHIPNLIHLRPRHEMYRYLRRPEEAHALRQNVISDEGIQEDRQKQLLRWKEENSDNHKKVDNSDDMLFVGIIQRTGSRRILNAVDIQQDLQRKLPNATTIVTLDYMENLTFVEQATWFATKDVIIAAHGACLANSIFIREGAIVLQLYPPAYFYQTLDPLIEQSGGLALDWYIGADPVIDWVKAKRSNDQQRGTDFHVPLEEVSHKVLAALGNPSYVWTRQSDLIRWPSEPLSILPYGSLPEATSNQSAV